MASRSITEASALIRAHELSCEELTRECINRIAELDPVLNSFITVTADKALEDALQADAEIKAGKWRGPLHGIPIGLKDLIDTASVRTTAASAVFKDRVPTADAEVVRRLRQAGAILVGKQNLHEFAYGGSSVISYFGPVRNPVNPECISGGSSGGSAAAVATGMCLAAIGTDTAGSVREPAALCGVVGLKPTYGMVSAQGVIPLSESLDHVGQLTRSVADAAILLDALTGRDGKYRAALRERRRNFVLGIPRGFFFDELDPQVASAAERAINELASAGFVVTDVEVKVSEDRTLQLAEAYRFHREMARTHTVLYHPETLRRILAGEKVTHEQYEASQRELANIREESARMFRGIDLLVTPTTPIPAPQISHLLENPDDLRPAELLLLRNTRPVNVWGLPAISVPCGNASNGLPIGLQIIGPPAGEAAVLQAASAFEELRL